jgi:hypothetical protein
MILAGSSPPQRITSGESAERSAGIGIQPSMETLKLAARPAVLILLWVIAFAHTISELSTLGPTLRAPQAAAATAAPRTNVVPGAATLSRRPAPPRLR